MTRFRSVLALPLGALLAVAAPALAAHAEGSVPAEVAAYVSDGSLVHQLEDVYGPDAAGGGIDFDDTTTTGTIERVHVWSEALLAGEETDRPVDILNEWTVPVSIAEEPVGLATVWINPADSRPELASFVADSELAAALDEVPDGASLVRDATSSAWLALDAEGVITPLVPGTTGLSTPVPLDDIAILPPAPAPPGDGGDPGTGVGFAIAVVVLLLVVVVVALVVPTRRRRGDDAGEGEADADAGPDPDAESDADGEPDADAEPGADAESRPEAETAPDADEPAPAEPKPKPKPKRKPKPKPTTKPEPAGDAEPDPTAD